MNPCVSYKKQTYSSRDQNVTDQCHDGTSALGQPIGDTASNSTHSAASTPANTEYQPNKCRITRPPPPKPAANPLQFIKVGPCPLHRKAQEQIKKVEQVKVTRQELIEEPEDWQYNLDNWKSSRRKQQEHIIERVEEVKKIEKEELQRDRRKTKKFSEIVNERSRGRSSFNLQIYDDDSSSNDLSDYGIGNSSSKEDSSKETTEVTLEDNFHQSSHVDNVNKLSTAAEEIINANLPASPTTPPSTDNEVKEEYTYEGAIQGYRSRIRAKINVNESIFNKNLDNAKSKEFSEAQSLLPKGTLCKRKELFTGVSIESTQPESARRISEDFANSQSIKQRLMSLEKCVDKNLTTTIDKAKIRPENMMNTKNENESEKGDIVNYLLDVSNSNVNKSDQSECSDNKSDCDNMNRENVDKIKTYVKSDLDFNDYVSNYVTSSSSSDLLAMSLDRDDSGIHTSDVSCSVSQSDEAFDDDIPVNVKSDSEKDTLFKQHMLTLHDFLKAESDFSSQCLEELQGKQEHSPLVENIEKTIQQQQQEESGRDDCNVYENVENYPVFRNEVFTTLFEVPQLLQPPTKKPPPPPFDVETCSVSSVDQGADADSETTDLDQSLKQTQTNDEDEISKKEREIIELVEKEEKLKDFTYVRSPNTVSPEKKTTPYENLGSDKFNDSYVPDRQFNDLDDRDSEVLKVEHELLQLEKEEFERQRENMLYRERSAKLKQNRHSYENIYDIDYFPQSNHRKSMPDLDRPKPTHAQNYHHQPVANDQKYHRKSMPDINYMCNRSSVPEQSFRSDYEACLQVGMRKPSVPVRNAPPKDPKYMHSKIIETELVNKQVRQNVHPPRQRYTADAWMQLKQLPDAKNYNQHWLYQEAELRRISEQNNVAAAFNWNKTNQSRVPQLKHEKSVQNKMFDKPYTPKHHQTFGHAQPMPYSTPNRTTEDNQDVILSVSGKKKCSYCGNELGRGAAMIIESLSLFYHMECFKCCVCHVQLGDGLIGTDVRVRNQKLHCHNCYSSDDGIKFSCV